MASLTQRTGSDTSNGWLLSFYTVDKRKRSLWLGSISKRQAFNVKRHVEELIRASKAKGRPEGETEAWAAELDGRLRSGLERAGLVAAIPQRSNSDTARLLGPFMDAYLVSRTDAKPSTVRNFQQAIDWTNKYFTREKALLAITAYDCEKLFRWMKQDLAESTATKHMKRLRTMLRAAMRDRLLKENPVHGLKLGSESNRNRDFFVDPELTKKVLTACPSIEWKLVFALPRYAGLRCPSELHGLRWTDIDWDAGRLRIDSAKTGLRFCPMFAPLPELLSEAWDKAPEGAVFVLPSHGQFEKNLRTHLHRIIESVGAVPWPKTFVNLRATRRTELEHLFPSHVVNSWLGHSAKVAEKHYLQIRPDDWKKAALLDVSENCSIGAGISAHTEPSENDDDPENPGNRSLCMATNGQGNDEECPRKDSNLGPAD